MFSCSTRGTSICLQLPVGYNSDILDIPDSADNLTDMWCSGDHKLRVNPTLYWRPDDRLTEGTPIPCSVLSFSPCVPVGGEGCALLGELELKLTLTVLGIGVDRVEMLHPVKREVDRVEILQLTRSRAYLGALR